ncbi:MAG TPA: hypothetical protein VHQ87_14975, partial [Rhizobacter sp.]|nr:hypothetical protein [Rhizobacter sp.]
AEYRAWSGMKGRCYNPASHRFSSYGGRGIVVCDRWRDSFENFFADMGLRPTPNHSLDRVNVDGPYCAENCRWATRTVQARNIQVRNKFGISGVYVINGKYTVKIRARGRTIHAGVTSDFFEACCLRKSAENRHWSDTSTSLSNGKHHGRQHSYA